jgi:hypothetical protein
MICGNSYQTRMLLQVINKYSGITIALALLLSCNHASKQKTDVDSTAKVQTFKTKDGWAYSIFLGKKEFIRQLYIPCIQGQIPFETDAQALKAGTLVLNKLKDHQIPSLNLKELEENHLLPAKDVNNNNK